ncbi:hypothetical protein NEOKW01_1383 [Nematocida sp. AWRm80]|nr:hypothetical protein NEOKW01_1383 [Nematocida sp. AWRm80]
MKKNYTTIAIIATIFLLFLHTYSKYIPRPYYNIVSIELVILVIALLAYRYTSNKLGAGCIFITSQLLVLKACKEIHLPIKEHVLKVFTPAVKLSNTMFPDSIPLINAQPNDSTSSSENNIPYDDPSLGPMCHDDCMICYSMNLNTHAYLEVQRQEQENNPLEYNWYNGYDVHNEHEGYDGYDGYGECGEHDEYDWYNGYDEENPNSVDEESEVEYDDNSIEGISKDEEEMEGLDAESTDEEEKGVKESEEDNTKGLPTEKEDQIDPNNEESSSLDIEAELQRIFGIDLSRYKRVTITEVVYIPQSITKENNQNKKNTQTASEESSTTNPSTTNPLLA